MFHVGQKVVCVDAHGYEPYLTVGAVYTIRWLGTLSDEFGGKCVRWKWQDQPIDKDSLRLRLVEMACECVTVATNAVTSKDWPMLASHFRPVVDISDLEAIVREQMLGKPRRIAPDKFDRKKVEV